MKDFALADTLREQLRSAGVRACRDINDSQSQPASCSRIDIPAHGTQGRTPTCGLRLLGGGGQVGADDNSMTYRVSVPRAGRVSGAVSSSNVVHFD
eukprot:COSAG01_NODE_8238_length_2860_cov_3.532054_4_plen_96_part_00